MKFKTLKIEKEFPKLDTRLQVIAYALDGYCIGNFGKEIFVTSVFRTNSATHARYCAFDMRIITSDGYIYFQEHEVEEIERFFKVVKYDLKRPKKPTFHPHPNRNNDGLHGHIQVYPGANKTIIDNGK